MAAPAHGAALQRPAPHQSRVARQVQTTATPDAGGGGHSPFHRHSRQASITAFDVTAVAYSGLVNQTLKPVGGYIDRLELLLKATGGVAGGTNAVAAADAPWNAVTTGILRDPYGQDVWDLSGWEGLRFLPMFCGAGGFWNSADPLSWPSFSAVAASGNFTARSMIPISLYTNGYTALASMNAAAEPQLRLQIAANTTVYSTPPGTTQPTLEVRCEEHYYAIPIDDPNREPPDLGSSWQHHQVTAPQSITTSSSTDVQLPRTGTWITGIGLVLRDSTQVRIEAFPDPIRLAVDGVDLYNEPFAALTDRIYRQFGYVAAAAGTANARPTGAIWYTFQDGTEQAPSKADTGDFYLPTTPGTLLEIKGTWGTVSNSPGQLTVITSELYPNSGIPYGHLSS